MLSELKGYVIKKINGKREMVLTPRVLKSGEYEDVIAIRGDGDGSRATNIAWVVDDWHPESDFEWGYSGTGPSAFAINILMHFTGEDEEFSEQHHREFRERFVRTLPKPGGRIKKDDILNFIAEKRK